MPWRLLLSLFGVVLVLAGVSRAAQQELRRFEFREVHMGTEFRVVLYAADELVARKAIRAAFAKVAELDDSMSDYKPTSELRRLCARAGGGPVPVSPPLFNVLSRSQALAKRSEGAFDVTVGPAVRLWRLSRRTRKLPDAEKLKEALARAGPDKLRLDDKNRTVRLLVVGMLLDLGGIAKGYAADAVLEVLRGFGITRALVAASGDIAVGEPPPGEDYWKVGIGPLSDTNAEPERYVRLRNAAVSTSGDFEQYALIDGRRYSHIVDPRTGLGLPGRSSVTVVAPDATTSDSLATTVSVLGPKQGLKLVEETPGVAALFVREAADGTAEAVTSRRFAEFEMRKK